MLPTKCVYMFCMILRIYRSHVLTQHNMLVFVIEMHYVHCEERTIFLIIFRRILELKSRTTVLPCDS